MIQLVQSFYWNLNFINLFTYSPQEILKSSINSVYIHKPLPVINVIHRHSSDIFIFLMTLLY
jgi:hypothetical protein